MSVRYEIVKDRVLLDFLTQCSQETRVFLSGEVLLEYSCHDIFCIYPDGRREETINHPSLLKTYLKAGVVREI